MDIDIFNNQYLSPVLKSFENEGKSLTLLGDFNIDLLTCDSKASHANFLDILGAHQMLPSITLPTRITDTSSTIIDNIFISPTDSNILYGNLTVSKSEHLPQFIFLDFKSETSSKLLLGFRRDWSKLNCEQFKNQFDQKPISWILQHLYLMNMSPWFELLDVGLISSISLG